MHPIRLPFNPAATEVIQSSIEYCFSEGMYRINDMEQKMSLVAGRGWTAGEEEETFPIMIMFNVELGNARDGMKAIYCPSQSTYGLNLSLGHTVINVKCQVL